MRNLLRKTEPSGFVAVVGMAVVSLLGFADRAEAIPTPATYQSDTGVELFTPLSDPLISIEVLDLLGSVGVGSEFGFYLPGSPGDLYTIFDAADQAAPDQAALISLSGGLVVDYDESVVQTTFAPIASGSIIGFYMTLAPGTAEEVTLYTEADLNPFGTDFVQAFRSESDTPISWFLNFENFGTSTSFGQYIVAPIAAAVPEPSALTVMAMGAFGLIALRRGRRIRSDV